VHLLNNVKFIVDPKTGISMRDDPVKNKLAQVLPTRILYEVESFSLHPSNVVRQLQNKACIYLKPEDHHQQN